MNNRYENEDASGECQVTGLLSVEKFTAPKLSLTSDSTWPICDYFRPTMHSRHSSLRLGYYV